MKIFLSKLGELFQSRKFWALLVEIITIVTVTFGITLNVPHEKIIDVLVFLGSVIAAISNWMKSQAVVDAAKIK